MRATVPGGIDLLFDCAGGQTGDQAVGAVRDGGRAIFIVLPGPSAPLERGITGESFAARVDRQRLEALSRLVEAGALRPQVEAVLPLDQAREALRQVAGRHTRGKVVLRIEQSPPLNRTVRRSVALSRSDRHWMPALGGDGCGSTGQTTATAARTPSARPGCAGATPR